MKIQRIVDIDVRVGEGRGLQIQDEVEFDLTAEEAVAAALSSEGLDGHFGLSRFMNNIAAALGRVPDAYIEKLSPEARMIIAGYLDAAAKRFHLHPADMLPGATK